MIGKALEVQSLFTLRDLIQQSVGAAKGYHYRWWAEPRYCYICGRQEDRIFEFTRLTPFFDMSLENKLVYICDDHGRVTDYDCVTGSPVELPLPRPYQYRRIRNILQATVLQIAFILRFVWFFSYSWFMWYVAIWPYWLWKSYKLNR